MRIRAMPMALPEASNLWFQVSWVLPVAEIAAHNGVHLMSAKEKNVL